MLFCLFLTFVGAIPGQAVFKTDQIHICVNIQSSMYTYKLTNLTSNPIVGFEVKQHAGHGFKVPQGWQHEVSAGMFKSWTSTPQTAIHPKKTAEFSFNVSTKGAILGRSSVRVLFQSGETVTLSEVWAPSPEPQSYVTLVTVSILAVLLLHFAVITHKNRRDKNNIS